MTGLLQTSAEDDTQWAQAQSPSPALHSTAMFAITTGILAFLILALGGYYGNRPGHYLSYLPTTMAGAFALLYASNTLGDVRTIR